MEYPLTAVRRRRVLELLRDLSGGELSIVAEEPVGHRWAPVTRLAVDREIPGAGRSVVVKTRRVEGDGYGGPAHLRRELAGLQVAQVSKVAPRLLAADARAGMVVTADLGRWPTLESVLIGDDADTAAAAMVDLGGAVGRLHAVTLDAGQAHREILEVLGEPDPFHRLGHWPGVDRWDAIESECARLDFPTPTAASADIGFVIDRLQEPGRFGALLHMDLNPTNVLITAAGVRLVDFEQSIFGHLGFDASSLYFPFRTTVHIGRSCQKRSPPPSIGRTAANCPPGFDQDTAKLWQSVRQRLSQYGSNGSPRSRCPIRARTTAGAAGHSSCSRFAYSIGSRRKPDVYRPSHAGSASWRMK